MKNNVIITSSGFIDSAERSKEIDELYAKLCNGKKVLIIDNAASTPKISSNYNQRVRVQKNFKNVGAIISDILTINENNTSKILDYDCIYVLGGDIAELVKLVNNTDFKEKLVKFLEKGIYIGESAGSIILSDDVKYIYDLKKGTKPKYDKVLITYKGLGLIDMYIFPHYNRTSDSIKEKITNYKNVPVKALNDGEYILCTLGT